jgi:hypothetical protein
MKTPAGSPLFILLLILLLVSSCKKEEETSAVQPPTAVEQSLVRIMVNFKRGTDAYDPNSYLQDMNGRDVSFDQVRMLLSDLKLLDANGNVTHSFGDKVVLIDRALGQYVVTELGMVNAGLLSRLAFNIGLDDATNQMDPTQFSGPPLTDQTLWINAASGHKFFTLAGRVDSNNDGIVGPSEQVVTYQCITSAMLRSDEVNTNSNVSGQPWTIPITIDMANILNGVNCIATPTAVGASAVNAQLMSNLQAGLDD